MISNEDCRTDGKLLHHSSRSKGSMSTITVGSRTLPLYPLVTVCLALLNAILLLTAVVIGIYYGDHSEESTSHDTASGTLFIEMNQLQIIQSGACKDLKEAEKELNQAFTKSQQLKLLLEKSKTAGDSLQKKLETLLVEKATLESNSSDILENCGRCPPGWFLLNGSCYLHAKLPSNRLSNWLDSRADCKRRGGDLVVIDTLEKQRQLFEHLPKLGPGSQPWWKRSVGIWIGLTDIETEGTWVWINNVTLQGGGYWIQGEPNNQGIEDEDCVGLVNKDNPRASWFDGNCNLNKEWLCEMGPISSGRF